MYMTSLSSKSSKHFNHAVIFKLWISKFHLLAFIVFAGDWYVSTTVGWTAVNVVYSRYPEKHLALVKCLHNYEMDSYDILYRYSFSAQDEVLYLWSSFHFLATQVQQVDI